MKHGTPLTVGSTIRAGKSTLPVLWIAGLAVAALSLVTPRQIGHLTDLFIDDAASVTWSAINITLLLILGAQLLIALLTFCNGVLITQLREKVLRDVERFLLFRVLRLPPAFFRRRTTDSITTRCLEDSWFSIDFQCRGLVTVPLAIATVATFGTYMMYNNWFLATVMLLLSLLGGYFLLFDRPLQRVNRAARESWDQLRECADETIAGVEALQDNFAFDYGLKRIGEPIVRQSRDQTLRRQWMAAFDAAGPLVNMVQLVAVYWLGAALCMSSSTLTSLAGELTWGQVIQFAIISTLFQKPVNDIFSFLKRWRLVRENTRRVEELFEWEPMFSDGDGLGVKHDAHDIEFEDVTVATDDGKRIINRVSCKLGRGNHTAIAGTAGSGKSTLLALLTSGADLEEGDVKLGGTCVDRLNRSDLAAIVGKVPQFPTIFSGTIRDNLLLSLRRPGLRILDDEGTPIALDNLPGVETREHLERRLLETIAAVDFERDLFLRAMDQHLGSDDRFHLTKQLIVKLRPAVRAVVAELDPRLVCWFRDDEYLRACTLGENLLGPGCRTQDLTEEKFKLLLTTLAEEDELVPLLQFGYQRLRSEEEFTTRLRTRAPQLLKCVPSLIAVDTRTPQRHVVSHRSLTQLSAESQKGLLQIALDGDAEDFLDHNSQTGKKFALGLRRKLRTRFPAPSWSMHEEAVYVDKLCVKDNLLGGRVDHSVHRADAMVQDAIYGVLAKGNNLYPFMGLGLDAQVERDGRNLSGGQRQKLALARAMLKNPGILLMDEATASLDELSENKIADMLRRQFDGKTVVSVSHRLGTLQGFDRIIVMDDGQKVQEGSFHELAQQEGLFQDLLRGWPASRMRETQRVAAELGSRKARGLDSLRVCPLFANLDSARLTAIRAMSKLVSCQAGDTIFNRGDAGSEIFVVYEGVVEFFASRKRGSSKQEEIVDTCGPGEAFGELAVFGEMRRTLGARARDPVRLLKLDRDNLVQLMHADPTIAACFLRILSRRIGSLRRELYDDDASGDVS